MKSCFVSMPVGRKAGPDGSVVDFDRVYAELVLPSVERANLSALAWRDSQPLVKEALAAIMTSDVFLADISTGNANVMYEIGVRHAANRGPTLLLHSGPGPTPFYIAYLEAISYDVDHPGDSAERLTSMLRAAARRSDGSPIYEFFPELTVDLPAILGKLPRALQRSGKGAARASKSRVAAAESVVQEESEADAAAYIELLRAYRDKGQWDEIILSYDSFRGEIKAEPQIIQLLALALNRRSRSGDQERAVDLLIKLIDETGGDAESLAILASFYKQRWQSQGQKESLRRAIEFYGRAFDRKPNDYYAGFNAAALLFLDDDPAAAAQLQALLPRVKTALAEATADRKPDYFPTTAALEIAVMERNWERASELADQASALAPGEWARSATLASLERLSGRLPPGDAEPLRSVIEHLQLGADSEEADDA